ncbi:MAG: phosphoadenosine phosphosulfate reductase family protein [Candidatus Thorarchaeota archaeon]
MWEIGFSGGKDSSVLCHLVFEYVAQATIDGSPLPPKIFILYADTLLDLPILRRHALNSLHQMSEYAKRFGELIEIRILKPATGEDYFSMVLDRGYSAPHFRYRWCMGRLKMAPTFDFLYDLGDFVMITGVRQQESNARRRNLQNRKQTKPIARVGSNIMVAPLLNWSTEQVWGFLSSFNQPWSGEKYEQLFELYRIGDNLEGCGRCELTPSSRFGCWICTVVRRDRLLENLANHGYEYRIMLNAKERIRNVSLTRSMRSFHPDGRYKGLNEKGKLEIVNIIVDVLLAHQDALEAYLENGELKQKVIRWIEDAYHKTGSPPMRNALDKLYC